MRHLTRNRHYTVPGEQRQILRILYMPPVYAVISFFSYRFFRDYTYYDLIETGESAKHRPLSGSLTNLRSLRGKSIVVNFVKGCSSSLVVRHTERVPVSSLVWIGMFVLTRMT